MASILKEQTKIDPLTVDQTILSERSSSEYEHPIRQETAARGLLDRESIVLTEDNGETFDIGIEAGADIHVVGPETKYADGRPTWMHLGARRRPMKSGPSGMCPYAVYRRSAQRSECRRSTIR